MDESKEEKRGLVRILTAEGYGGTEILKTNVYCVRETLHVSFQKKDNILHSAAIFVSGSNKYKLKAQA